MTLLHKHRLSLSWKKIGPDRLIDAYEGIYNAVGFQRGNRLVAADSPNSRFATGGIGTFATVAAHKDRSLSLARMRRLSSELRALEFTVKGVESLHSLHCATIRASGMLKPAKRRPPPLP